MNERGKWTVIFHKHMRNIQSMDRRNRLGVAWTVCILRARGYNTAVIRTSSNGVSQWAKKNEMKAYAIYEDGKLMALCLEPGASSTLQGEIYHGHGDKSTDIRIVEIDAASWKTLEEEREKYPEMW